MAIPLSYGDNGSISVNVPNSQGGYTALIFQKSGTGFTGPQGEFYPQFPTVAQLQVVYGLNTSQSTTAANNNLATVTVEVPPPALPVYEQPAPPDPSYIWAPGYWAYNFSFDDYYWVPGTWVTAPYQGLLWTPGYWHWRGGYYVFSNGYWASSIGFYGGINYGFGYGGHGFSGGAWRGNVFVNRTYNVTNITNNNYSSAVSFNGGPGGTNAKPTPEERAVMKAKHFPATAQQKLHVQAARKNPALRASLNHGRPAIAATARPGVFKGKGIAGARKAGVFYNRTKPSRITRPHQSKKVKKGQDQWGNQN